jgi:hypothetical protein
VLEIRHGRAFDGVAAHSRVPSINLRDMLLAVSRREIARALCCGRPPLGMFALPARPCPIESIALKISHARSQVTKKLWGVSPGWCVHRVRSSEMILSLSHVSHVACGVSEVGYLLQYVMVIQINGRKPRKTENEMLTGV